MILQISTYQGVLKKCRFKQNFKGFKDFCVFKRKLVKSLLNFKDLSVTFNFKNVFWPSKY